MLALAQMEKDRSITGIYIGRKPSLSLVDGRSLKVLTKLAIITLSTEFVSHRYIGDVNGLRKVLILSGCIRAGHRVCLK